MVPGSRPALLVQNESLRPVTVRGRRGEPFARISKRGVEVNLRSPTHQEDQRSKGAAPSGTVDAAASPRWRRVEEAPRYLWFDSRANPAPDQPPDELAERRSRTVLTRWSVPLESPAGPATIRGTTSWVPVRREATRTQGSSATALIIIGLAMMVGLAAAAALRLARRRTGVRG